MPKLDNNSKLIISKYLYGYQYINFINTFNLYEYYFTTFKYIIIDIEAKISKTIINKIINNLKLFPNLNEIILNIIYYRCDIEIYELNKLEKYYNIFKSLNKQIKFKILDKNLNEYNKIFVYNAYIKGNDFLKNIFIPNLLQKYYITISSVDRNTFNFNNYNNVLITVNKVDDIIRYMNLRNVYFTYDMLPYALKINNIDDIYKYFIVDNRKIINGIKYVNQSLNYLQYIKHFPMYYEICKFKHDNNTFAYLNNYITSANNIRFPLLVSPFDTMSFDFILHVLKMYKYGVKNIYDNILNYNTIIMKYQIITMDKDELIYYSVLLSKDKYLMLDKYLISLHKLKKYKLIKY